MKMTGRATFRLLLPFFVSLLQRTIAQDSCSEEGSLTIGVPNRLLKVCLFGHWSYVCRNRFGHNSFDSSIALYQLGCDGGTTSSVNNNSRPVYLTNVNCFGVERRLMDCRHGALQNITDCDVKVRVNCSTHAIARVCENGELRRNKTTKVLNICHNGTWLPLCPYLWQSSSKALVACRQLYPDKTIIGGHVMAINDTATTTFFRYHYHCTGNEKNLTDCTISAVNATFRNQICASNEVIGIDCVTENASNYTMPTPPEPSCSEMMQSPVTVISTIVLLQQVNSSCSQNEYQNASPVVITAPASSPPLVPWVAGIIIGAVLSAVIIFIVLAIVVFLLRRNSKSQHTKLDNSTCVNTEGSASYSITNGVYSSNSTEQPQAYEEFQPINKPTESEYSSVEPEYSYAAHAVNNTNVYDSVPQQNNNNIPSNETPNMPVVDNTALYSMCGEAECPTQKSQM